jgi:site-specific recombinase XerD
MNANFGLLDLWRPRRRAAAGKKRGSRPWSNAHGETSRRGHLNYEPAEPPSHRAAEPQTDSSFLEYLEKQRQQSPNTVRAYGRDLEAFEQYCLKEYGSRFRWEMVDRLGARGFLGELQRRGLAKRSIARGLSAVRAFYRYLQREHDIESPLLRAAKAPKLGRKLPTYLDRSRTETLFEAMEARQ